MENEPTDYENIPNPDALGLIPNFDPPPGEEHPDERIEES